jgi:flagellar assembly protein FliH
MSSKVLLPGDGRPVDRFVWRQAQEGGSARAAPAPPAEAAGTSQAEWNARLAELERAGDRRAGEARAAGLREGEAAGRARAGAETKAAMERLAHSVGELSRLRAGLRKEAEADVVKLALAIARRVLRRELAVDPDALRGLVLAALEKLESQEINRVRIHPSQAALLAACLGKLAGGARVEVVADGAREPGDVVFETQRGNLDASVETQLQEVERGLADHLRRRA